MNKLHFSLSLIFVVLMGTACQTKTNDTGESLIQLRYHEDYTPTWYEVIDMYKLLDEKYSIARMTSSGMTDSGKPLHVFVIDKDKDFHPDASRKKNKQILFINNGIHPGEPCGIEASLMFADDLLRNKDGMQKILDNTVICIIPIYNIGGALYRSHFHRTNQPGPYELGYRGNAKNLDLNRDFVKMDTENAKSFTKAFRLWNPDVFLDTHTTNGSDHQYCITLIPAQHNSMQTDLGSYFNTRMVPELYRKMKSTPYELIPYVQHTNNTPESGIENYVQTPRFSTGYAQLFNALAFMTENQCYKPYSDRVESAYHFILTLAEYTYEHGTEIREMVDLANQKSAVQEVFPLRYQLDTSNYEWIEFKGYHKGQQKALLSDESFEFYDYSKPFTDTIPFYNNYIPSLTVKKPAFYILPQAWSEVVERLELNQVNMHRLAKDTSLTVNVAYIDNLIWSRRPDNGHFIHQNFTVRWVEQTLNYFEGDYVIPVDQSCNQFIVNQLEPEGADSYFRWNFFDPILENREWFSPHPVLEAKMVAYMERNPEVRKMLDDAISERADLAGNRMQQMYLIYKEVWENKALNRYPVSRLEKDMHLPLRH